MEENEGNPPDVPSESVPELQEEEDNLDAIADQLLARLDAIDQRLTALEERIASHSHDGYAANEHSHESRPPSTRPKRDHFWFRNIRD
jgi:hypothetical protein